MGGLRRVLVVDDDPVVGLSFRRVLDSERCAVTTAEDGYDALVKLQRHAFDLVVTDIRMPGIDGLSLAERVRAHKPWIPVLIVSGHAGAADEDRAAAAGVALLLHKPLSPRTIVAGVEQALACGPGRRQATRL